MAENGYGGQGPLLMAVGWVEALLGVIVILFRLYGASRRAGEIRWDFVWIALAGVFGITSQALFTVANWYGMGNHLSDLDYLQVVQALKWIWMAIVVGLFGLTFAKWAIIALLLQVHLHSQTKRRAFLWSLGFLLGAVCAVQTVLVFTQCKPARSLWDPFGAGSCPYSTRALYFGFFQGASGATIDLVLAIYPVSIVWNLQANMRMKIGFCCLMAGGIVPAGAGIAKTVMLDFLRHPQDITYEFASFMTWATTELWLIIILGSLPPLRPLFISVFRKAASTICSATASRGSIQILRGDGGHVSQNTRSRAANLATLDEEINGKSYISDAVHVIDDGEEEMLRNNGVLMGQIVMTHEHEVNTDSAQGEVEPKPMDLEVQQEPDRRAYRKHGASA